MLLNHNLAKPVLINLGQHSIELNKKAYIFTQENALEIIVYEFAAIYIVWAAEFSYNMVQNDESYYTAALTNKEHQLDFEPTERHPVSHPVYGMLIRADSRFAPSQWEMPLLCNDVSHLLGASLESALLIVSVLERTVGF